MMDKNRKQNYKEQRRNFEDILYKYIPNQIMNLTLNDLDRMLDQHYKEKIKNSVGAAFNAGIKHIKNKSPQS